MEPRATPTISLRGTRDRVDVAPGLNWPVTATMARNRVGCRRATTRLRDRTERLV